MSFTYDLAEDVGKLRLMVGDSVFSNGPRPGEDEASNYSDEELQHFIDHEGSVERATGLVFETLSAEWSTFATITLGPRKEELSKIAEAFAARGRVARQRFGGGSSFSVGWSRVDGYSEAADAETELVES